MKLPQARNCDRGCGQDIVVLPERGSRWLPFDADLVSSAADVCQLGHVLVRLWTRPLPVRVLVPAFECHHRLLEGIEWRIMRHRCEYLRFLSGPRQESPPASRFDLVEGLSPTDDIFDLLSSRLR